MEHLFSQWDKLKESLRGRSVFLFLDYDGTLSPIVKAPHKAVISKDVRNLLKKLSQKPEYKVAIISGRSLMDIKKRVGIKDIIYSGNHGLEVESPKIKYKPQVSAEYRQILENIRRELEFKIRKVKGAIIEDKGLSLAVHFREAGKQDTNLIKTAFREVTILPSVAKKIKIRSGKKVLEAGLPVKWDKGTIVLWLLSRQKFATNDKEVKAIYIGDDATDEDAFKALRKDGITVFVGEQKPSYAKFRLKDSKEVYDFLNRILDL
jgi:trehalose-phosphatase